MISNKTKLSLEKEMEDSAWFVSSFGGWIIFSGAVLLLMVGVVWSIFSGHNDYTLHAIYGNKFGAPSNSMVKASGLPSFLAGMPGVPEGQSKQTRVTIINFPHSYEAMATRMPFDESLPVAKNAADLWARKELLNKYDSQAMLAFLHDHIAHENAKAKVQQGQKGIFDVDEAKTLKGYLDKEVTFSNGKKVPLVYALESGASEVPSAAVAAMIPQGNDQWVELRLSSTKMGATDLDVEDRRLQTILVNLVNMSDLVTNMP